MKPTETQCPVCQSLFVQPSRPQGGGRRSIYCSSRCRSLDWARGNGSKRKASVITYETKPENKEKKRERNRKLLLRKYNLSDLDFFKLLERQHSRCAGCQKEIDQYTARIDHDHRTNKVRGLLCDQCNWALGLVRDQRSTLYQLAAYLELDRTKPVIYLIGSLRNPQIPELGNQLRELDFNVVDNWFAAGKIADDSWQAYSDLRGRSYKEALESREANNVFYFDRSYIHLSDVVVLVAPFGKSGALEFGYSVGIGKRGFILMEEIPERYDVMMQFASSPMFHNRKELFVALQEVV